MKGLWDEALMISVLCFSAGLDSALNYPNFVGRIGALMMFGAGFLYGWIAIDRAFNTKEDGSNKESDHPV